MYKVAHLSSLTFKRAEVVQGDSAPLSSKSCHVPPPATSKSARAVPLLAEWSQTFKVFMVAFQDATS